MTIPTQRAQEARENAGSPTTSAARFWLRLAIVLWAALAMAHAGKSIAMPTHRSVYPLFREAGESWRTGQPIYRTRNGNVNEFFYSPVFAVAMVPFSLVPLIPGSILWSWFNLGVLFFGLRSFFRVAVFPWRPHINEGQFLSLCAVTTIQGGWSAQSNSLILACILWGIVAVIRQRFRPAAFWLALPVYIKVWPIVAAALLSVRAWKPLPWRLAVALVAVGLIPFLTAPPERAVRAYHNWSVRLIERNQTTARYPGFRDAYTLLEETTGPPPRLVYKSLQAGVGLLILAWCVRNLRQGFSVTRWYVSTLAWWTVWQLLLGPGTERLTYGIAAPAVAGAVLARSGNRPVTWLAWLSWLTTGLLGTGDVERLLLRVWPAAEIIAPLGVVMLALCWLTLDLEHESGTEQVPTGAWRAPVAGPTHAAADETSNHHCLERATKPRSAALPG